MERLSSGKKINTAADDAAVGFAIAERMTAQIRGLNMATKNANDGLSMLAVVENATNDVTDMLQRICELAVQAANDSNSLRIEFSAARGELLLEEVNRVATQTKYNNKVVLDGTLSGQFQVGTEKDQTISFSISSIETDELEPTDIDQDTDNAIDYSSGTYAVQTSGLDAADYNGDGTATETALSNSGSALVADGSSATGTAGAISILTAADATDSLAKISSAIEQVAANRASYGALQNRLEYTVSTMNVASSLLQLGPGSKTQTLLLKARSLQRLRYYSKQEPRCWLRPTLHPNWYH